MESQGIELVGNDSKVHFIWATSTHDAYESGIRWGYRHGGLKQVNLLILQDEEKGCWDRAIRIPFGRQCNLETIVNREIQIKAVRP